MKVEWDMNFVIDMGTGTIYRSKEKSRLTWFKDGSQVLIPPANARVGDERSVVTAEQYMHFDAKGVLPHLAVIPDNPKAKGKRVGFIDTKQFADGLFDGDLTDPRKFFASGVHSVEAA